MYGVNASYVYTIRCLLKNSPGKFLAIIFFWIIIIFGHALRICERLLNIKNNHNFKK